MGVDNALPSCYVWGVIIATSKASPMPLSARQIDSVKSLLRRAAELIEDAQNVADAAGDRPLVIRLNTVRRNVADEIADLERAKRAAA